MDAEKEALLANFTSVTGIDNERAIFYLEAANWQIEAAIEAYYSDPPPTESVPSSAQTAETNEPASESASSWQPAQPASRMGTIGALKQDEPMESDSEEEADTYYVGGSERGAHGAEEVESGSSGPSRAQAAGGSAFRGTGYKLGEEEGGEVQKVAGAPLDTPKEDVHVVLKLWKNGFSVDDGELRDFHDPENRAFLQAIKQGEVPQELIRLARGAEVDMNMEDHRDEEYVKPKTKFKAFGGEGQRLGSPSGGMVQTPPADAATAPMTSSIQVDSSKPVTTLQLRLADGSRLVARFNHSHTVADVRAHILASRPDLAGSNFCLQTTFPNKELTELEQSLDEAKLLNAVIVQRMK